MGAQVLTEAGDRPWPRERAAWMAAVFLALGNSLSFVDRTVLTLLIEPIKADLGVSDTAISLLSGFSFVVFFVLMGLPIAWLADRGNRRNIVALAMLAWSATTAACGLAWSYTSLLVARAGTGAGEGALSPAAQSMLADYFPPHRLPLALGLFSMGIYVGNGLALLVGGAVVAAVATMGNVLVPGFGVLRPWQLTFIVVGAPGIVLAVLMLAVREPVRRGAHAAGARRTSWAALWAHCRARAPAYAGLFGAFALLVLQGQGSGTWIPAFFGRKFHWGTEQIGAAYGSVVLVFGTAGALIGGVVASRLRRSGRADANVRTIRLGFLLLTPFAILFPLAPDARVALALVAGMNFFAGFPFAAGYAALQELTPNRMRAQVAAAFMVVLNLIGGGVGPTLIAVFTDFLFGDPAYLPHSLSLAAGVTLPVALLFLVMLRRAGSA